MVPVDKVIGRADWIGWPLGRWTSPGARRRLRARAGPRTRTPGGAPWVTAGAAREPPRRHPAAHRDAADGRPRRPLPGRAERRRLARKVKRKRRRSAVQGDTAPHRRGAADSAGPQDLPGAGLRDPVGLHGADDPDRRPGAGGQAHPVVRLQAAARGRRRLQGPRRLAPGASSRPTNDDPIVVKQVKQVLTFIGLLPSDDEQDLIKRVVGVGGDTVKCCDDDGPGHRQRHAAQRAVPEPGQRALDAPVRGEGARGAAVRHGRPPGRTRPTPASTSTRTYQRHRLRGAGSSGRAVVIAWPFGHWRRLEEPETYRIRARRARRVDRRARRVA